MTSFEISILLIVALACLMCVGVVIFFEAKRDRQKSWGNLLVMRDPVDGEVYLHLEFKDRNRLEALSMTKINRVTFDVKRVPYKGDDVL